MSKNTLNIILFLVHLKDNWPMLCFVFIKSVNWMKNPPHLYFTKVSINLPGIYIIKSEKTFLTHFLPISTKDMTERCIRFVHPLMSHHCITACCPKRRVPPWLHLPMPSANLFSSLSLQFAPHTHAPPNSHPHNDNVWAEVTLGWNG